MVPVLFHLYRPEARAVDSPDPGGANADADADADAADASMAREARWVMRS